MTQRTRRTKVFNDFEPVAPGAMSEEQIVVRLPTRLLDLVDAHAHRMRVERPTTRFTRSDAVRDLLYQALSKG